jgi:hypothetical protein
MQRDFKDLKSIVVGVVIMVFIIAVAAEEIATSYFENRHPEPCECVCRGESEEP